MAIKWKIFERSRQDGLKKITQNPVVMVGHQSGIRTQGFPTTKQNCYSFNQSRLEIMVTQGTFFLMSREKKNSLGSMLLSLPPISEFLDQLSDCHETSYVRQMYTTQLQQFVTSYND